MVNLDNGFLSSFDCAQRMGAVFFITFLAQIGILASLAHSVLRPSRYGPAVEWISDRPLFTRRRSIVYGVWCAIFIVASTTCACLRTTTAVFLDSTSVVETSCSGPFHGEYRLDRTKLKTIFDHDSSWLSKRPLDSAYLVLTQADKPRPIFIHLAGRPGSKELIALAPEAMDDYARFRANPYGY